jgi:hypothetical protein
MDVTVIRPVFNLLVPFKFPCSTPFVSTYVTSESFPHFLWWWPSWRNAWHSWNYSDLDINISWRKFPYGSTCYVLLQFVYCIAHVCNYGRYPTHTPESERARESERETSSIDWAQMSRFLSESNLRELLSKYKTGRRIKQKITIVYVVLLKPGVK